MWSSGGGDECLKCWEGLRDGGEEEVSTDGDKCPGGVGGEE